MKAMQVGLMLVVALALPDRASAKEWSKVMEQGRRETLIGAILLPTAAVLAATGAGVFVLETCTSCSGYQPNQGQVGFAGAIFSIAGMVGVLVSIPILIAGAVHKHQASRQLNLSAIPRQDPPPNLGLTLRF